MGGGHSGSHLEPFRTFQALWREYRGTSPTRNRLSLGPCKPPSLRTLLAVSCERGAHVKKKKISETHRKVDVRLPGKGNSNSHGARPVHLIITMITWIRTSRLSIKKSLSRRRTRARDSRNRRLRARRASGSGSASPHPASVPLSSETNKPVMSALFEQ